MVAFSVWLFGTPMCMCVQTCPIDIYASVLVVHCLQWGLSTLKSGDAHNQEGQQIHKEKKGPYACFSLMIVDQTSLRVAAVSQGMQECRKVWWTIKRLASWVERQKDVLNRVIYMSECLEVLKWVWRLDLFLFFFAFSTGPNKTNFN